MERLRRYITFKEGFIKYATHQLSPAEEKEVEDAMNYVISCAPDNKAVIYTEARDLLNVPEEVNRKLVAEMNDNNPKKWYLRGILEADKEEKMLEERNGKGYIPEYLCFFNHAFELEPAYKWLYFFDGQISDQLREKYKYRNKDKQRYREMFYDLVTVTPQTAAEEDDLMNISGEEE